MVRLCKNCKHLCDGGDWGWSSCIHDACFKITGIFPYDGGYKKERLPDMDKDNLNFSLQCQYYERKRWKFWVKNDE